jgi:hypothetical protein
MTAKQTSFQLKRFLATAHRVNVSLEKIRQFRLFQPSLSYWHLWTNTIILVPLSSCLSHRLPSSGTSRNCLRHHRRTFTSLQAEITHRETPQSTTMIRGAQRETLASVPNPQPPTESQYDHVDLDLSDSGYYTSNLHYGDHHLTEEH